MKSKLPYLYILFFISCSFQQGERQSIGEIVSVMENAQKNQAKGILLCQQIQDIGKKDECLLLILETTVRKNIIESEKICNALSSLSNQSECYFRLAEYSQKKEFCLKSTKFMKDCQLHLFSRALFRNKPTEYYAIASLALEFDISPESIEGQTVIYRHILSLKKPIPITECQNLPNPKACQKAAQGLYLDRLRFARSKNQFPCDTLGEFEHSNEPILLHEYQQMAKEECP